LLCITKKFEQAFEKVAEINREVDFLASFPIKGHPTDQACSLIGKFEV
jgi:hypothetical protein